MAFKGVIIKGMLQELNTYQDQAVLGPDHLPQSNYTPIPDRSGPRVNHRDLFVLSLHLSGSTAQEIAELAGYSNPASVYNVLRKREVILVRQQLLEGLELEFEVLQKEIFDTVKAALRCGDMKIRLEGVQVWMKYFGKFLPKENKNQELTAEDVVKQLLNQQINIQVNVGQNAK